MAHVAPIRHTRVHDYGHLVRQWRSVARAQKLSLRPYASASGYELFYIEPRKPAPDLPWIYLSAGIHGDEPAPPAALLEWVATRPQTLREFNLLAFPCLNPWGLVNNTRTDANGRDLNRTYHTDDVPQTAAHKAVLADRRFALAIALHEDYDANGIYIYEIPSAKRYWAESLLETGGRYLPIDTRRTIEGRRSNAGIVRRAIRLDTLPEHPEALTLHFKHADRTLTVETPSEAHIDARIAAHIAMLDRAMDLCLRSRI